MLLCSCEWLQGKKRKFGLNTRDEASKDVLGQFRKGLVCQSWGFGFGFYARGYGELLTCFRQKTLKDGVYDLTHHSSHPVEDR